MGTNDSDEQSLIDKGKDRLRGVTSAGRRNVRKATDTFTGKAIEDSIAEYTDVYTQVLLGINAKLEEESSRVDAIESDNQSLRIELSGKVQADQLLDLRTQIISLRAQVRIAQMIAVGAIVLSLGSLAGVIWIAI